MSNEKNQTVDVFHYGIHAHKFSQEKIEYFDSFGRAIIHRLSRERKRRTYKGKDKQGEREGQAGRKGRGRRIQKGN